MKFRLQELLAIAVCGLSISVSVFGQTTGTFSRIREIKLLKTERTEIESLFRAETTGLGRDWTEYARIDGRVTFHFSPAPCSKEKRDGWDVPKGTVTRIFFEPKDGVTPEKLGIDLKNFRKYEVSDAPGQYSYENPKTGMDVGVSADGTVSIVEFYPAIDLDEKLGCIPHRR